MTPPLGSWILPVVGAPVWILGSGNMAGHGVDRARRGGIPRRRPPQFIDRALNAVSDDPSLHVAGRQQLIGTLGGV